MDSMKLAKMIDLTLLKPTATKSDIEQLCKNAVHYGFICVVVNPCYVSLAYNLLRESEVKVCTVIGFPLGANLTEVKAYEAKRAVELGASEIDMVMNIGAFKSGDYDLVRNDIFEVVRSVKEIRDDVIVKVIIETCYLTDEEKIQACSIIREAGADFVKTSTGFGPVGATLHDVKLLRNAVGSSLGVKAAGGIRDLKTALAMIEAGANRIGASAGVKIVEEMLKSNL